MYWNDYIWFITAMLFCTLFSAIASGKVHSAFSKYSKVRCRSGKTGYDTVAQLLWSNRVNGISVGRVKGNLSDHYDPRRGVVNLSESTYGNSSVASVAVAAHEMGHVMQKQEGYWFYRFRTALVSVVNFGSRLAFPLVLIGLLLDAFVISADPEMGFHIAMIGPFDVALIDHRPVEIQMGGPIRIVRIGRSQTNVVNDAVAAISVVQINRSVLNDHAGASGPVSRFMN